MEPRFADFAARAGLDFGQPPEVLERIGRATAEGAPLDALLEQEADRGLQPAHLLALRRAFRQFLALVAEAGALVVERLDAIGIRAQRFGARLGRDEAGRQAQARALAALAGSSLKHGRLRLEARKPLGELPEEVAGLAGRTEGLAELPPHRWFAARRAAEDGLLELRVVFPEEAVEPAPELARAAARAVLEALQARAEAQALETAALGLHALLARPPLAGPVAGVLSDGQRLWVHVEAEPPLEASGRELGARDLQGLIAFLAAHGAQHVGLAAARRGVELTPLLRALAGAGLAVERVREAGLMKQARGAGGALKASAARILALRLKDPLAGHAGLGADELGLGEYLDQVHADRLRAALEDVRAAVAWERRQGRAPAPTSAALARPPMQLNPMLQGLDDLRPGMELDGTVANLTDFGAFVELGLPVQGLVHLSELAEAFVKHPSEVVQVGQRVRARVLEVNPDAGRLSLSLRAAREPDRRKPRPRTRAQALDSLDQLFRKK